MPVPSLGAVRVDPADPLASYLWIGLRDRQLFGYTRSRWEGTLGQPGTSRLVLAGPHPLTPDELIPTLDRGGMPGVVRAQSFEEADDRATIYRVEPTAVRAGPSDVAMYLSPAAAIAWLDLAGGGPGAGTGAAGAATRLAESGAIVVGAPTESLAQRLAGVACLVDVGDVAPNETRIVPVGADCEAAAAP